MISGVSSGANIRKANVDDVDAIKAIADRYRDELGFVLHPALRRSIEQDEVMIAEMDNDIVGFMEYHHRRDQQTTLYHIAVVESLRGRGIGRELIEALSCEAQHLGQRTIKLKCPVDLSANEFYPRIGAEIVAEEEGKNRKLNVWEMTVA